MTTVVISSTGIVTTTFIHELSHHKNRRTSNRMQPLAMKQIPAFELLKGCHQSHRVWLHLFVVPLCGMDYQDLDSGGPGGSRTFWGVWEGCLFDVAALVMSDVLLLQLVAVTIAAVNSVAGILNGCGCYLC